MIMGLNKFVFLMPISALLVGCVSYSGGDKIKQLPNDIAASARVGSILVRNVPDDVSPQFKPSLESELRKKTTECAKGSTELSLEVSIAHVKTQNPALTVLVGNSNNIRGIAEKSSAITILRIRCPVVAFLLRLA
jgi:hypothetical protein